MKTAGHGLGFGVLLGLAAASAEASVLSFDERLPLSLSLTGVARYDDNVRLDADPVGDAAFVFAPAVLCLIEGASLTVDARLGGQFVRYAEERDQDADLADLEGRIAYRSPRTSLTVEASHRDIDLGSAEIWGSNFTQQSTLTDFQANADWELSAKTRLNSGVAFERAEYATFFGRDYDTWRIPLGLGYRITQTVQATLGYDYRRGRLRDSGETDASHTVRVGATGDFTARLTGKIAAGVTQGSWIGGSDADGLAVDAGLTFAASPLLSFGVDLTREFRTTFRGETAEVTRLATTARYTFDLLWTAEVEARWEDSAGLTSGADDRYFAAYIEISRTLSERASVQTSVLTRRSRGGNFRTEFDSTVVSLSASFRL